MKVAFDTTFLQRPPSGIGAYVAELAGRLPGLDPEVAVVQISEPDSGIWTRMPARAERFAWEFAGSGLAARKLDADLLHVPVMARPIASGCPVVVTVHDVIPFVMPEYRASRSMRINLAASKAMLRFSNAVITPSHNAANDVIKVLGVPRSKVWITPEAADSRFKPGQLDPALLDRFGISGPYIFNVGGLDVRKNLRTLIRAFADVVSRGDRETLLVIAGSGHASNPKVFPPLEPLIQELGLGDRVILTGRISDEDKIGLLQSAQIYVTPSLHEGFGLTVLEAMACGVPIIAANRTSLPEVVGRAGMLVEPRVLQVSEAMSKLLGNPSLRDEYRGLGLEQASRFSWEKTASVTLEVYRHVLGLEQRQTWELS